MKKMHRVRRKGQPPFGAQVAFARVATGLAWTSLGALAVGASAASRRGFENQTNLRKLGNQSG